MKWLGFLGTFLEMCGFILVIPMIGKEALKMIERKFILIMRSSYHLILFILISCATLGSYYSYLTYKATSYRDFLNPVVKNYNLVFNYEDRIIYIIAYGTTALAFLAHIIYCRIGISFPTFFYGAKEQKTDVKEQSKSINSKNKNSRNKKNLSKEILITKSKSDKPNNIMRPYLFWGMCLFYFLGSCFHLLPIFLKSKEILKIQSNYNELALGVSGLILASSIGLMYLLTIFNNNIISKLNINYWIKLILGCAAGQITLLVYYVKSNLYLTINIVTIIPFALFGLTMIIGTFISLIIYKYEDNQQFKDIKTRFFWIATISTIIGLSMQLISIPFS
jgi:hypothetical protein